MFSNCSFRSKNGYVYSNASCRVNMSIDLFLNKFSKRYLSMISKLLHSSDSNNF